MTTNKLTSNLTDEKKIEVNNYLYATFFSFIVNLHTNKVNNKLNNIRRIFKMRSTSFII